MVAPLGSRLSRTVLLVGAIAFAGMVALSSLGGPPPKAVGQASNASGGQEADASDDDAMIDPMGPNAACYVPSITGAARSNIWYPARPRREFGLCEQPRGGKVAGSRAVFS